MTHWEPVFDREQDCKTLNLILSPGRVATTSLYLWTNRAGVKLYKTHTSDQKFAQHDYNYKKKFGHKVPFFLEHSRHVLGRALNVADPVRLVLPTRNPLARNLSAFRRFLATGRVTPPANPDPRVLADMLAAEVTPDRLDVWISRNLDPILSLDDDTPILGDDQPTHRFTQGRIHVLALRSEIDDADKGRALSDFFDHEIAPHVRDETAEQHNAKLSDALRAALDALPEVIPDSYRHALGRSRYARLFYPEMSADAADEAKP